MSEPRVIKASYSTWRPVQGRKVLQLVFEVPIEQQTEVLTMLGAPDDKWVAIALLNEQAGGLPASRGASAADVKTQIEPKPLSEPPRERPKRAFKDLSYPEQAGIRCNDATFIDFLTITFPNPPGSIDTARDCVCRFCGVASRAELSKNHNSANRWRELESRYQSYLLDHKYADARR